jgi:arylsulfatase A-like enzyme
MATDRPNVLLILSDQQRRDSLGCYGNRVCNTPNLDRLAASGIRFERNYVANPICMPNRLSLFTGQHIHSHGLWTNGLLLDERRTLAHEFAEAGYQTASFGKIHFTPCGGDEGNRESEEHWRRVDGEPDWHGPYWGFEHVELTIRHTQPVAHYGAWLCANGGNDAMLVRNKVSTHRDCVTRPLPASLHDSTFVGQRAARFITAERDTTRPFFVVASFPDPHHPFDPPAEVADRYPVGAPITPIGGPDDLATRPAHYRQHLDGAWHRKGRVKPAHPGGISETHARERTALTYAMVDLIDRSVGTILDAVETSGMAEDTIVVFTSDHGELLGDHGLWSKGPFFYEGLINTPLLIRGPGLPRGAASAALFSDVDLAPTLCELTGVPVPLSVQGLSQRTVLTGEAEHVRDSCLIEYRTGYGRWNDDAAAVVTADEKYVRYTTGEEEYTHLAADPHESTNRAGSKAAEPAAAALRARLLQMLVMNTTRVGRQVWHG